MILRVLAVFTVAIMTLWAGSDLAGAQDQGSIRRLLLDRDKEIKAVLAKSPLSEAEEQALRAIVNDLILFSAMGKTALGPHWNDITEAQRSEFVETFSAIVREQSLADLDPYHAKVTIETVNVDGASAKAVTKALYKDVETTVEYDFVRVNDQWWISDISLDGVSTADGYARSFQSAIRKRGFDGLMDSLRKRLDRIKG